MLDHVLERPATPADLRAVVDLFCAYEERTRGFPDTDDADVAREWELPGWDFEDGTRVVEDDGVVIGYALVTDEHADTVAVPGRPEVSDALLAWVEAHPEHLEHYVPDGDADLGARLERRGWVPERRFWRMRRELSGDLPAPVWPAGVTVSDFRRPDDERAVHELISTSFREIGGQHERTFEQWSGYLLDTDLFDASLYLVAVDGERVAGASLTQVMGGEGFVRQLAVAPSHRGRGLGLALLHETFRRLAEQGLPTALLGVDAGNPTGAIAVYEKAGMAVHEQFTRWDWR